MYLQEILEVVIGLIYVWLLLALACVGIQEWVSRILNLRARELEKAIGKMLDDPGLTTYFYNHPLIKGLSISKRKGIPSYIPKNTYARVLFDMVMTAGSDTSSIITALNVIKEDLKEKYKPEVEKLIIDISNKTIEDALSAISKFVEDNPRIDFNPFAHLTPAQINGKKALYLLKDGIDIWIDRYPQIIRILNSITTSIEGEINDAEEAIAAVRTNLEEYFDQTMDRLVGVFRRKAQLVGLIIGLIVAIAFNVDAITIGTMLWREPTIRSTFVARASLTAETPLPIDNEDVNPQEAWEDFQEGFVGLKIPIGWNIQSEGFPFTPVDMPDGDLTTNWIVTKALGWFISGAAAAQGAPFWFDVLKKVTNMRAAGINPNEKKEQENAK